MATRKPTTYHCPATRWSLDDLVAALQQRRLWTMSRSSIWRLLDEADLKPHRSVYWLNSHDPDFEAKAQDICALYLHALRCFAQGRMVICSCNTQVQETLADTLEVVQEIAQAGPYAFHRVTVYTGTVRVTTSVLACAMVDCPMVIIGLGEMVDIVFIGEELRPGFHLAAMMGLIVALRTFSRTSR